MMSTDVAVVGAGPAGSSTAKTIAEKGYDVILIERDSYPGENNVCAGGIPKRIAEEMGVEDTIEKEIKSDILVFPWGRKEIERDNATVHRRIFDKRLAEIAVESGAKILTNTIVKDVTVKDDFVLLNSEIAAKIVVFADGPNTLAYRKFRIGFRPESDKTVVSVVCELEWKNNELESFEMYFDRRISPWGYGWIFPKRNLVNVGVGCLYSKLNCNIIEMLKYFINDFPLSKYKLHSRKIVWLRSSLIPVSPAEKIYGERILVVGDAAGMVDPISGGGIAHAIEGGKIAGEVCVKALEENDFSENFLSLYDKLWRKTKNYRDITTRYLLSNIFLYLSKFDENAFAKLADFGYGKENKIKKIIKLFRTFQ